MGELKRKLVIVGDSAFAEIACEYFSHGGRYEVVGFCVEESWIKKPELMGLSVTPLEQIEQRYPCAEHDVFVAIVYTNMNRLRERLVAFVKQRGYALASYVSPHAWVAPSAKLGEHCFIFENNVVQSFTTIGNNVILWSGNHIGHHSTIGEHCFISSHVVISGFVSVGHHTFMGVNATVANNVEIGHDCWVGPSVIITRNVAPGTLLRPVKSEPAKISSYEYFKLPVEV